MKPPVKIVSGGQAGVDRAALDWAIANRLSHGGWCPAGRRAEDRRIPSRFRLGETRSRSYLVRTRWNVRDSDGTVIFSLRRPLTGGSKLTSEVARKLGRPVLHLTAAMGIPEAARQLNSFLKSHRIAVLNIAGPRASEEPDVGEFVRAVLTKALNPRRP